MNATSAFLNQSSIVRHILLEGPSRTLHTAMEALKLQSMLFSKIGALVDDGETVADLVHLGRRTADDAAIDCDEHAASGDIIGAADCLARVLSGHRIAKNLLSTIAEIGNANVAEMAQLGVKLAKSVFTDLGYDA
ncbi:hypothetical protein [Paraburkholderia tropica]|uniref:hypothetical protein n=1 Tax=Paraburkholderia tropica TaxID=92647 RepID=UPI002AB0EE0E|nr:hypothetical protein [Paraburkholderia tropica]